MPGPNGQPPIQQHDPTKGPIANPRRQLILRNVFIYAIFDETAASGERHALVIDTPTEQIVFPMEDETAKVIGTGLAAPHVQLPGQ